ncbi:transmembrane protein [Nitzschia inconspicua]|uniref:Transmembrane protein n=1 Tax=Nitzschia inconspicua TaxID=303405 RepID=A0A9K3LY71_9STRA|nr:transmembrane protein [Nitzschia inconspicua]
MYAAKIAAIRMKVRQSLTTPSSLPCCRHVVSRRCTVKTTATASSSKIYVATTQRKALSASFTGSLSQLPTRATNNIIRQSTRLESTSTSTTRTTSSSSSSSSSAAAASTESSSVELPTTHQKRLVFAHAAVPMIGFGFIDQTIMIYAGNIIDCTLGVAFGLSTLTAASVGALVSNSFGVIFGNTLEACFGALGLPRANLSSAQRQLPLVKRITFSASVFGMVLGGLLGLLNLLLIDTDKSSTLKLYALHDGDDDERRFAFTIEASNVARKDATCLTVHGPDVDGLLASMTAALSARGCNIVEIHATRQQQQIDADTADTHDGSTSSFSSSSSSSEPSMIHDVFYVVDQNTGEPFDDDELEELAQSVLDATRTPVRHVQAAMLELEQKNTFLEERVQKLERILHEKQISVVASSNNNGNDSSSSLPITTTA